MFDNTYLKWVVWLHAAVIAAGLCAIWYAAGRILRA